MIKINNDRFVKFEEVSYETTKQFGTNQENRQINHAHLSKIMAQMRTSFSTMPPITINMKTMNIIDGQHRLKAYQRLIADYELSKDTPIRVMYVDIPFEEEKQAIIDANTNSKNWSLDDYIASYAKAGIEYYVKLENWCKGHSLACASDGKAKYRYGAAIITGKGCSGLLKAGTFSFTDEEIKRAEEIHAEMEEFVQLFDLTGYGAWIEALAITWNSVRNMHPFKIWLKEMKLKKKNLMKLPKDNIKQWESIFSQVHMAIDKKGED